MAARAEHSPQIAFLLGKPIGSDTVLAGVLERMHHRATTITLHRPVQQATLPKWLFQSDLVVQRGLDASALASASELEGAGVRCCNSIVATQACKNRAVILAKLASAGIRVPATSIAETWDEVCAGADREWIVVKEVDGTVGRGLHVLIGGGDTLPPQPPFPGPYIVQEHIANNGIVQKLYVAGRRMRGLIKNAAPMMGSIDTGVPFDVDPELEHVARRTRRTLGLDIVGVDVLIGEHGPVVIDVNPFPGFRGVPDGARLIANHLTTLLEN